MIFMCFYDIIYGCIDDNYDNNGNNSDDYVDVTFVE